MSTRLKRASLTWALPSQMFNTTHLKAMFSSKALEPTRIYVLFFLYTLSLSQFSRARS